MPSRPDIFQQAVSFDWDALLPFVFFLLFGLSQLFGRKKNTEEAEPADEEALERARQIREEIRRKIEARRQATAEVKKQQEYDPTLPDSQQRRLRPQQMAPQPAAQPQPVRRAAPAPVQRQQTHQMQRQKSLEELLKEQRRQVEESRRKMQAARERAHEMEKHSRGGRARSRMPASARKADVVQVRSGMTLREQLQLSLRRPDSVRQAILLREILDKPLGLR